MRAFLAEHTLLARGTLGAFDAAVPQGPFASGSADRPQFALTTSRAHVARAAHRALQTSRALRARSSGVAFVASRAAIARRTAEALMALVAPFALRAL